MFETSSSSSSLLSNGSSRSSQTDDLSRTVDGYAEEAEQHLEQALKDQEDVATDIKVLMQLLRQVTCVASRIYIYGYGLIELALPANRRAGQDQPRSAELEAPV